MKKTKMFRKHTLLLVLLTLALSRGHSRSGEVWPPQSEVITVIGQASLLTASSGSAANELYFPLDVCIDPETGKVFVADAGNNRVLRYSDLDSLTLGSPAEAVFGQADFGLSGVSVSDAGMSEPNAVALGPDGSLWVAENGSSRVLRFDDAVSKPSGSPADGVLGQAIFTTSTGVASAAGLLRPRDVAVDASGNLYIADMGNNRVILHLNASSKANGADADQVLGQSDFTTKANATSDSGFRSPNGVHIDSQGTLYVSDSSNNRIMVFDDAINLANGSPADRQLGQPDFETMDAGLSASEFDFPSKVFASASDTLFICDKDNQRVLVYYDASTASGETSADSVIGQPDFQSNTVGGGTSGMHAPWGCVLDASNHLYVAAFGNNRIAVYDSETVLPDVTIGRTGSEFTGDDVYNTSASGQTRSFSTRGRKVKMYFSVGNDGSIDDSLLVQGRGGNSKFKVKTYFIDGSTSNVSAAVHSGGHSTSPLPPESNVSYRTEVTPKKKYRKRRAKFSGWLQVTSDIDGDSDKVIGKIKNRPR